MLLQNFTTKLSQTPSLINVRLDFEPSQFAVLIEDW